MENPIKMDDLGVPLFSETSIYVYSFGLFRWIPLKSPRRLPQGARDIQRECHGWIEGTTRDDTSTIGSCNYAKANGQCIVLALLLADVARATFATVLGMSKLPASLFFLAAATFSTTKQSLSICQSTVRFLFASAVHSWKMLFWLLGEPPI